MLATKHQRLNYDSAYECSKRDRCFNPTAKTCKDDRYDEQNED